ncbi:MAG: helix-turn-helix domain-containing protein [Ekhidna sp.]
MIYIAGISIALFIAALLLNKKGKSKSDYILFGWMLLMALHLSLFYINFNEDHYVTPRLLGIELPMPLLHGIFLYWYVASVTNQLPRKGWIILLHFVPIIASYIYLIDFFSQSNEHKADVYHQGGAPYATFTMINYLLMHISGVVYVVWSSVLLWKHKSNIRTQFSALEEINLKWLRLMTVGIGTIWAIIFLTNQVAYIFMGVSGFIILIGFFGVQQKDIFSGRKAALENSILEEKKSEKYAKSGLTDQKADDAYNSLLKLITVESIYRKHELSLNDLAAELGIHPNYLSQIINEKEKKNFFDFVNTYRVEEFKRRIVVKENHQLTLMAIAYDCGFNSKSSFNRYFKKHTGKTPSQYFKAVLAEA